ncbi:MAG: hypothetical protein FD180_843 [Planctomycetota bacterium]|nr:MAG: hypothetical protein FD180_843 [Planctomycetota bacterium]
MSAGRLVFCVLFVALAAGLAGFFAGRSTRESRPTEAKDAPRLENRVEDKTSQAAAPDPRSGSGGAPASPSKPPDPAAAGTPVARLFAALIPKMGAKTVSRLLYSAALNDAELQHDVFKLLMESDDPALLEVAQDLLIRVLDPGLVKEVLAAYQTETLPARRLALAYVLGANWKDASARPVVMEILGGSDTALQARALTRPCLQNFDFNQQDIPEDLLAVVRRLAVHGGNDEVRAKAARSMRGAQGEDDVRFLIGLMKRDPSPAVRVEAMNALPVNWTSEESLHDEQVRACVEVALDASSPMELRKDCADRAIQESYGRDELLTPVELARLKELSPETR